jgi:hypothetical protein
VSQLNFFKLKLIAITFFFFSHISFAETIESKWYDNISLKGDTRFRWEGIYREPGNDNERERFRTRLGLSANVVDDVEIVFRFETGIDDPVSSNQTFGQNASGKGIGVGRAYVNWRVNEKLNLMGGKMKMPWFTSGGDSLLWDGDLNPEGIFGSYKVNNIFVNGGYIIIDQDSEMNDVLLHSFQIGKKINLTDDTSLITGIGYYDYNKSQGNKPFYKAKGNSLDNEGNYLVDYDLFEFFTEIKTIIAQWPTTLHLKIINNSAINNKNKAYSFGVNIGSSKKQGEKQFGYAYHDTEKDALIGSYSDSDFAGGNTDSKGHIIRFRYGLRENITLGATMIISKYQLIMTEVVDYNRVQIDLGFRF